MKYKISAEKIIIDLENIIDLDDRGFGLQRYINKLKAILEAIKDLEENEYH